MKKLFPLDEFLVNICILFYYLILMRKIINFSRFKMKKKKKTKVENFLKYTILGFDRNGILIKMLKLYTKYLKNIEFLWKIIFI